MGIENGRKRRISLCISRRTPRSTLSTALAATESKRGECIGNKASPANSLRINVSLHKSHPLGSHPLTRCSTRLRSSYCTVKGRASLLPQFWAVLTGHERNAGRPVPADSGVCTIFMHSSDVATYSITRTVRAKCRNKSPTPIPCCCQSDTDRHGRADPKGC